MATSDAEILELYRVSLHNVSSQPQVAEIMAEFGYGPVVLAVGKARLAEARAAFDGSRTEKNEASAAYQDFNTKRDELSAIYALDKRKARGTFGKEPVVAQRLAILGNTPRAYIRWLEAVRTFYSESLADPEIQRRLARMRVTPEHLDRAIGMVEEVEAARARYIQELGESQNATKLKDAAFARVDDWMKEFYFIAKIALEESPQLAESLGRLVRS